MIIRALGTRPGDRVTRQYKMYILFKISLGILTLQAFVDFLSGPPCVVNSINFKTMPSLPVLEAFRDRNRDTCVSVYGQLSLSMMRY